MDILLVTKGSNAISTPIKLALSDIYSFFMGNIPLSMPNIVDSIPILLVLKTSIAALDTGKSLLMYGKIRL